MRPARWRPLFAALLLCLPPFCPPPAAAQGQVLTWGKHLHYLGSSLFSTNPLVAPPDLTNVIALASGLQHVSALRANGTVTGLGEWEWGLTNVPTDLSQVIALSAGDFHTLALTRQRQVRAWGASFNNQCLIPAAATNVVAVAAGGFHSLALRADGQIVGWGDNRYGQADVPANATNVVALAAGRWHSLAILDDGRVLAWGYGASGQTNVPASLTNTVGVEARASYSLGWKTDGAPLGWGLNDGGQLSLPATAKNLLAIGAGDRHVLALLRQRSVVAWGNNTMGQTVIPPEVTNVCAVSAGSLHSAVALGDVPPQPASAQPGMVVRVGRRAVLTSGVSGSQPMTYQWRRNGVLLPGATRAVLALKSVQLTDSGTYSVIASNAAGRITNTVLSFTAYEPELATARFLFRDDSTLGNWKGVYGLRASVLFGHATNVPAGNLALTAGQLYAFATNTPDARALERADGPAPTNRYFGCAYGADYVELQAPLPLRETNFLALYLAEPSGGRAEAVELFDAVNGDRLDRREAWSISNGSYLVWEVTGPVRVRVSRLAGANAVVSGVFLGCAFGQVPLLRAEPVGQTVVAGARTLLAVGASGEPALGYQWRRNGLPLTDSAALSGTRSPVLTLNAAATTEMGAYSVVVTNTRGLTTSTAATIAVIAPDASVAIVSQPQSLAVPVGAAATFQVVATSTAPLNYQWRFNGTALAGATQSALSLANVQLTQAGGYSVVVTNGFGSVTSAVATLTVTNPGVAPAITSQPKPRTNGVGSTATFTVTATGTATLAYQWRFNGTALAGATQSALSLANVQLAQAGGYSVVVTNGFGSVTSAVAALTVTNVGFAPVILEPPAGAAIPIGYVASFSVTATGTPALAYQWRRNGTAVAAATQSTLTIAAAQPSQAGDYTVVVTNGFGAVTSAVASLVVSTSGVAPAILLAPASQTNRAGATAQFSVIVSGSAPMAYQWRFNGTNLPAATSSSLVLDGTQPGHAGSYQVAVTNPYGAVTSAVAQLVLVGSPRAEDNGCFLSPRLVALAGGLRVRCFGEAGQTYIVQSAPSLAGPWLNVSTNVAPANGTFDWVDPTWQTAPRRFYRTAKP